jgi:hypothetical protein
VGLERGPLSLVSTIEELLGRKSSGFGLESREYGRRDPSRWPRGTLYPQKLELTSPTSGGRSVGIVRLRTHAKEFRLVCCINSHFVPVEPCRCQECMELYLTLRCSCMVRPKHRNNFTWNITVSYIPLCSLAVRQRLFTETDRQ